MDRTGSCYSKKCKKTTLIVLNTLGLIITSGIIGIMTLTTSAIPDWEQVDKVMLLFNWFVILLDLGVCIIGLAANITENYSLLITNLTALSVDIVLKAAFTLDNLLPLNVIYVGINALFLVLTARLVKQVKEESGYTKMQRPLE